MESVGLVLGTKEKRSEALEFWVGVFENSYLQLDDVVWVETSIPGTEKPVRFYGVVQYVSRFFEGIDFDSDTQRAADGILPVNLAYAANISITRVIPEIYIPPKPGEMVHRAQAAELQKALFTDKMERKIAAGILRTGEPYYLNFDFINGENGAHISISGVSGVATKTTYACFLLYSILHSGVLQSEATNTKAIIFNVKGEDLLFLDKKNNKLQASEEAKYGNLELPTGAFSSVNFYAPAKPSAAQLMPSTEQRLTGISAYAWTLRQIGQDRLFSFLFADAGEDLNTFLQYIRILENRLYDLSISDKKKDHEPIAGAEGQPLSDLFEMHDDIQKNPGFWFGAFNVHQGQLNAILRRLHSAAYHTRGLIRPLVPDARMKSAKIDWQQKQLTVIDIHTLPAGGKMFVVGSMLKKMFREKEEKGTAKPLTFIVIDELNKYAPREGWSPIKDVILDISERGRSMGIILIGAQQTASEIELRVYANSAIKAVGRMDSAEVEHREYGFLGTIFRQRAKMITPGTVIINQPNVPTPVLVRFPFPAWATRPNEIEISDESDPFDDL